MMSTSVTSVAPAESERALRHFESLLEFETDCWDVYESMSHGPADFVLADVRSTALYAKGHVAGAISLPHATIAEDTLARYAPGTVFVVYCNGPHCNGAYRAAIRLARLGRPVKIMIGGVTGWLDEGFALEEGAALESGAA